MKTAGGEKPAEWVDYWRADTFWKNSGAWEMNARIFMRKAASFLEFKKEHRVLSFGCGAGHLEALIAPRVRELTAVDISPEMINTAAVRCAGSRNVSFECRSPGDFDFLRTGKYNLFLAVSVVQYLESEADVLRLIASARAAALPGAVFLIADIPAGPSGLSFFFRGLCEGHAARKLLWAAELFLKAGAYRKASREFPLLCFSREQLEALLKKNGLKGEVLRESFSINAGRHSLLVYLNP